MAGILMTDPGFGRGHTLGVSSVDQGTSVPGTQKTFTDSDHVPRMPCSTTQTDSNLLGDETQLHGSST